MRDAANLNIFIPMGLKERTRRVSEKLCLTTTAIIRTALEKEIVLLEEKIAKDAAARALAKEQRRAERAERSHFSTRKISERVQSRGTSIEDKPNGSTVDPFDLNPNTRLQEIYRKAAEQVLLAGDDREAIKRVLADALKAVQRECPLTYPDDATVVREIEREVKRQRDSGPTEARGIDSIVDATSPDEEE